MVNKSSQFINKANVRGRVNTFISVCSSACEKMGGRSNIYSYILFLALRNHFHFIYLMAVEPHQGFRLVAF